MWLALTKKLHFQAWLELVTAAQMTWLNFTVFLPITGTSKRKYWWQEEKMKSVFGAPKRKSCL